MPSSSEGDSPLADAEKLKFRRDSQDVLANILELKQFLEENNVKQWSNSEYAHLQSRLSDAQLNYQRGDYRLSLEVFSKIENSLKGLANEYQPLLDRHIEDGDRFFEAGDAIAATAAFQKALLMSPDNVLALTGKQRAQLLPQLLKYLVIAEQYHQQKDYQSSLEQSKLALSLDKEYTPALLQFEESTRALKDSLFQQKMSAGYQLLEQQKWQQAQSSFEQAAQHIENRQETISALALLKNTREQFQVKKALKLALEYEQQEHWREALEIYQQLLKTDPGLVDPAARIVKVKVWVAIDDQLQEYLSDPLVLSNEQTFIKAEKLIANTRSLAKKGSRLQMQLDTLGSLLRRMDKVQTVEFMSDGFTDVTLYRVGPLGRFMSKSYDLKPGKYVAAGGRAGYRDVRVEFTLTGLDKAPKIKVQCTDAI